MMFMAYTSFQLSHDRIRRPSFAASVPRYLLCSAREEATGLPEFTGESTRHLWTDKRLRTSPPGQHEEANRRHDSPRNPPQVMSTPQPHGMNRHKTNYAHQNKPERSPNDPDPSWRRAYSQGI